MEYGEVNWIGFFVAFFCLCSGFIFGFLYGAKLGFDSCDIQTILECQHAFKSSVDNATALCVERVKRDVNFTAIVEDCRRCESERKEGIPGIQA